MSTPFSRRLRRARTCAPSSLALLFAATFAACGGGGGDATPATPATPAAPAASTTTISGTAATGAALAGAAVSLKCATGSGSATTASDGRYSVQLSGTVAAPCVVQASLGSTRLHSVVDEISGGSATANVTPLSELIVARVAAADPAAFFAAFDAAAQARVTPTTLMQSRTAVQTALQGLIDLSGIDPIHDALIAATGSAAGNTHDQRLDALNTTLTAARITLADLTTAFGNGAPIGGLIQPAAASCAALRSGRYRLLAPSGDATNAVQTVQINAAALTMAIGSGGAAALTRNADCDYRAASSAQLLIARSGIGLLRSQALGGIVTAVLLPEQTLPLADAAGRWNALRFTRSSSLTTYMASQSVFTLDANGRFSEGLNCIDLLPCSAWPVTPSDLSAASDGGFVYTDGGVTTRLYAFKAGDGRIVAFGLLPNATGFLVATKQVALTLPAVGDVSNVWDYTVGNTGFASALFDVTTNISAINTAAPGSFTRVRASDGRIDGFTLNTPRTGLRHRAAGSSPVNGGGGVSFTGIVAMPLGASIGITPYINVSPSAHAFGLSINKP